jgi:dipeptidyl aminopeptidase/acylaminoacyl peptidase
MTEFDMRDGAAWTTVENHFRRLYEPAFGRPHRIEGPTVSADGTRVAVTGSVYDELAGLPREAICVVEAGELHAVTSSTASSRHPCFSPDRAQSGRFQLHLLRADRLGEADPTPEVPGTVEYAAWSPDGSRMLLGVAGLGADLAAGQGSGRTYRPTEDLPGWHPLVEGGTADEAWRSLWVYELATDDLSRLSPDGLNAWEACWSGTDAVLAVTSSTPDEAAWYTAVLTRIDLAGATATLLRSDIQIGWPAGSPDGRRFAVVEAVCSDRWVVAGEVLVATVGEEPEQIDTLGIDVTATRWIDDKRLGVLGLRGLETVVATYDVTEGKTTELWSSTETGCGQRYPEAAWTTDGRAVIVEDGYRQPQQCIMLGDGTTKVLAGVAHPGTDYLMSVAGSAEAIAWSAPDGLRIEGLLCKPAGEGPFPLVINIHGGPVWSFRNSWSLSYPWTPLLVANGYAVLNPNPRGSSGRGQQFARLVFGEMGGDDTHDFTSAVDALVERGVVDPTRVGLMGGSYGGFMSAWLVTQDQRWAAAVPIAPVTNWYSQHFTSNIPFFDALFLDGNPEEPGDKFHSRSPVAHASKVRTPCLNIAGALDRCTPPTQAQEFHRALLEHGVESMLAIYPEEGHGVRSFPAVTDFCARVLDWFQILVGIHG